MARPGFLADNIHFCRARSGVHGKAQFVDDRGDCLMDIGAQMQVLAALF